MSRRVVIVLDKDRPRRLTYFRDSANRVAAELDADGPFPLHTGRAFVDLAGRFDPSSVEQVIVCAHGGPTWLLHHRTGVASVARFPQLGQVSIEELVWAWAPVCTEQVLWSLCACLCARSPSWWLWRHVGYVGSTWGPRSYKRGGQASFAARLRDQLVWHGHRPDVRGQRSAGDLLGNPIKARLTEPLKSQCVPLVELALPKEPITIGLRRWWTRKPKKGEELACKVVKGRLAERWLLGDDSVPEEIAKLWAARG